MYFSVGVSCTSSYQPTSLGSIYRCIFFLFGLYPDGTFHRTRQRRLPHFPGKNPSVVACCTPRYGVRSAFYVVFLSFISRKVAACVFKRVSGSSAGSIQFIFEVGAFKKAVLFEDRRQCQRSGCSISVAEYFTAFSFFFLQNYTFTPFCRRFTCWYLDPSSWASVVERSNPELGRSSQPEWSSGSVALYTPSTAWAT